MKNRTLLLGLSISMLSACGTQQPAVYNYYGVERGAGSAGIHTVLQGDTLYSISRNYQIPMREIILLNKLKPPYVMNAGYRMKLPPPNEYIVRAGDSIQSVAQLYEVSPNRLANLNGLRAPYYLPPGQVLRLPTPSGKNSSAKRYTTTPTINKNSSSPRSVERQALKTPRTGTPRTGTPNLGSIVSSTAAPPKVAVPTSKPVVKKTALNKPELKKPQVKTKTVSRAKTPSIPKLADGNFMRPVDGKIISSYGAKKDGLHNDGINIKAVKGTPVRAAQNGVVVYNGDDLDGYGNLVLIRHENKMMTAYAHLDKTLVKRGEKVARGQSIGTVGKTGQVDTPQLHFEVRKGSTPLNPDKYL